MRTISAISLFLAAISPSARSQNAPASPMRDAVTHEQLCLTYRKVSQDDPMRNMKPAKGTDPSVVNQPKDLLSQSDILCFGGAATLVPKMAVLNIPKNLANRLKFQPGSKIQSWSEFYALNRGWITTVEVTRVQAEGNQALADEIAERMRKSANLVVATYLGGPISMLPPKVAVETDPKAPAETTPKAPAETTPKTPAGTGPKAPVGTTPKAI